MSVISNEFSALFLPETAETEGAVDERRDSVPSLPPLTAEQARHLEQLMARGDLPYRQETGRGASRMLGVVALGGFALTVGAAYAPWSYFFTGL